jgi:large subunit ribosomal protein L23
MPLFKRDKNKREEKKEQSLNTNEVTENKDGNNLSFLSLLQDYGILRGFYVSEKATKLSSLNQYVFKVFKNTTKNEIKKQVEKSFNVKVAEVKIIKLPSKKRMIGQQRGLKSGFKKAVVILKKGYSINQAKI